MQQCPFQLLGRQGLPKMPVCAAVAGVAVFPDTLMTRVWPQLRRDRSRQRYIVNAVRGATLATTQIPTAGPMLAKRILLLPRDRRGHRVGGTNLTRY